MMIQSSEKDDWRLLGAKIKPFIEKRVSKDAVDDVLQDTFLRMHRSLSTLKDDVHFGSWVYQIARSAVASHHESRKKHPLAPTNEVDEQKSTEELLEEDGPSTELAECLIPFVVALPSPYREAITLTELQGLTQKEAAEMVGVSLSAMKSRVLRGREKLKEMLEACCLIEVDARGKVLSYEARPELRADCCPLVQVRKKDSVQSIPP